MDTATSDHHVGTYRMSSGTLVRHWIGRWKRLSGCSARLIGVAGGSGSWNRSWRLLAVSSIGRQRFLPEVAEGEAGARRPQARGAVRGSTTGAPSPRRFTESIERQLRSAVTVAVQ